MSGLEARARWGLARYERALQKAVTARGRAHRLLDEAHGIEATPTGSQTGELRRARAELTGQGGLQGGSSAG